MYRGYRKSTCTSVNHVVCHGIPIEKPLREGDIVNVDVTLILDGWHGDSSRMYAVGEIPRRAERLIEVTYEGMMRGIAAIKPGATTGDIGHAIQSFVEAQHMSVVRDFCGHGLGRLFHDEPNIVHIGRPGEGIVLKPGMFFTVEPMINLGRPHVKVLSDGWTAVTRDRSLSAQFEHTVGVTDNRRRDFHAVAEGPRQSRLTWRSKSAVRAARRLQNNSNRSSLRTATRRQRTGLRELPYVHAGKDARELQTVSPRPHRIIPAIASGCGKRFREAGADALSDYELLEQCCSARCRGATSSRSPRR